MPNGSKTPINKTLVIKKIYQVIFLIHTAAFSAYRIAKSARLDNVRHQKFLWTFFFCFALQHWKVVSNFHETLHHCSFNKFYWFLIQIICSVRNTACCGNLNEKCEMFSCRNPSNRAYRYLLCNIVNEPWAIYCLALGVTGVVISLVFSYLYTRTCERSYQFLWNIVLMFFVKSSNNLLNKYFVLCKNLVAMAT